MKIKNGVELRKKLRVESFDKLEFYIIDNKIEWKNMSSSTHVINHNGILFYVLRRVEFYNTTYKEIEEKIKEIVMRAEERIKYIESAHD